jgi:hypothetical protein
MQFKPLNDLIQIMNNYYYFHLPDSFEMGRSFAISLKYRFVQECIERKIDMKRSQIK